jgi:hypothetical protein
MRSGSTSTAVESPRSALKVSFTTRPRGPIVLSSPSDDAGGLTSGAESQGDFGGPGSPELGPSASVGRGVRSFSISSTGSRNGGALVSPRLGPGGSHTRPTRAASFGRLDDSIAAFYDSDDTAASGVSSSARRGRAGSVASSGLGGALLATRARNGSYAPVDFAQQQRAGAARSRRFSMGDFGGLVSNRSFASL